MTDKNKYNKAVVWIKEYIPNYQDGLTLDEIYQDYCNDVNEVYRLAKRELSTLLHFQGFYKNLKSYFNDEGIRTTTYVYFYDEDLKVEL